MFNVYLYTSKRDEYRAQKEKQEKEDQQRRIHVKKRNHMSKNYRRRVDEFIADMYDRPIVNSPKSTNTHFSYREEDQSRFLGGPTFKFTTFKTERERIEETLKERENLETKPLTGKFELRPRDTKREIHPQMRFTHKNAFERVVDTIDKHGFTESPSGKKSHASRIGLGMTSTSHGFGVTDPKHLRADLHKKTHFKAATTISLGQGGVLGKKSAESNKIVENFLEEETTRNEGGLVEIPEDQKLKRVNSLSHSLVRLGTLRAAGKSMTFADAFLSPKNRRSDSHRDQLPTIHISDAKRIPTGEHLVTETRNDSADSMSTNPLGQKPKQRSRTVDQLAKLILGRCNVVQEANPKIRKLHKGEGHLSVGSLPKVSNDFIHHDDNLGTSGRTSTIPSVRQSVNTSLSQTSRVPRHGHRQK